MSAKSSVGFNLWSPLQNILKYVGKVRGDLISIKNIRKIVLNYISISLFNSRQIVLGWISFVT